jgi:Right handed beta helix region
MRMSSDRDIMAASRIRARAVFVALALVVGGGCSGTGGAGGAAGRGGAGGAGSAGATGAAGVAATGAGGAVGDGDTGAPPGDGSAGVAGARADAGGPSDAAASDAGACAPSGYPTPTGVTIDVRPPLTLAAALATAAAGDRVVVHAGTYAKEQVTKRAFASFVSIEAAAGETVTFAGATFTSCDHLAFRGVHFSATVLLDGSSHFVFSGVTLDGGATQDAALQLHGQSSAGPTHDVLVEDSTIGGGGRTIFVLGVFAPSDGWNHDLTFVRDDITCGSFSCFQVSGGRDMVIDDNRIHGTTTSGVFTAGATRVAVTRNRFLGQPGTSPAAVQLATPGAEWDNYAGVENMISSAIVVANNVVTGWATGVQLDAARDVAIVYDTVADGTGVSFDHRTPHDQMGHVILDSNSDVRVWDDVLPSITLATGETGPSFESNDVVWKGGGAGPGLVTTAPAFAGGAGDDAFALAPGSVGVGAALVNGETPLVDVAGRARGAMPDVGAFEPDGPPSSCP